MSEIQMETQRQHRCRIEMVYLVHRAQSTFSRHAKNHNTLTSLFYNRTRMPTSVFLASPK